MVQLVSRWSHSMQQRQASEFDNSTPRSAVSSGGWEQPLPAPRHVIMTAYSHLRMFVQAKR